MTTEERERAVEHLESEAVLAERRDVRGTEGSTYWECPMCRKLTRCMACGPCLRVIAAELRRAAAIREFVEEQSGFDCDGQSWMKEGACGLCTPCKARAALASEGGA